MANTITLDGVEPTQVILMKDPATGKVLVKATYRVKAGSEVVKTVMDRSITFSTGGQPQVAGQTPTDLLTAGELTSVGGAWDAIAAALQRAELS